MADSNKTIPLISDQLLEDYADGRLDSQTERRVEGLIANDHALRDRVLRTIAIRESLRAELTERAGESLRQETLDLAWALEHRLARPQRSAFRWVGMATAAVVLLAATVSLYEPLLGTSGGQRQHAAVESFLENVRDPQKQTPKAEVQETEAIPVTAEPVPKMETAQPIPEILPDFVEFGFDLVETRMITGDGHVAVHLLYEGEKGRRVSLYYSDADEGRRNQVSVRQEGPLALLFWNSDGRSFSMIGEVQRHELVELAQQVTAGFSLEKAQAAKPESEPALPPVPPKDEPQDAPKTPSDT